MFKNKVLLIVTIVLYVAVGVAAIVLNNASFVVDKIFLGSAIILANIPLIFIYLSHEYYKEYKKIPYLVFILGSIVIGLMILLSNSLTLISICMMWGIFDIVKGAYEAFDAALELKQNKFELIEIAAAIGEIVFGVLLIIHLSHGLPVHLIYLGIASFLVAIKYTIDIIRKGSH